MRTAIFASAVLISLAIAPTMILNSFIGIIVGGVLVGFVQWDVKSSK